MSTSKLPSRKKGAPSPTKAKKILKEGRAQGKKLAGMYIRCYDGAAVDFKKQKRSSIFLSSPYVSYSFSA